VGEEVGRKDGRFRQVEAKRRLFGTELNPKERKKGKDKERSRRPENVRFTFSGLHVLCFFPLYQFAFQKVIRELPNFRSL